MNILAKIIADKRKAVEKQRKIHSINLFEQSQYFDREIISLKQQLANKETSGIIAEIKRGSPSEGIINEQVDVKELGKAYMHAGASAVSILTDEKYFHGSTQDLISARPMLKLPILRKDFIVDEYQLVESKSIGADCILLIAACLDFSECELLARMAKSLGLETLLEVRNDQELSNCLSDSIDIVGVNNRNLDDFSIDMNTSVALADVIPSNTVKISESGFSTADQIAKLQGVGFDGFLIGTNFMKEQEPGLACQRLINELKNL